MPETLISGRSGLPDLGCACANLRRAARLVTQLYSHEMGAAIEPGQFSLLSALSLHPELGQARLAHALGLDKTTMSRNLRVMEKNRWIAPAPTEDSRESRYRLTPAGQKLLSATRPAWLRAQARLRATLKAREWDTMSKLFGRVAEAAYQARHDLLGAAALVQQDRRPPVLSPPRNPASGPRHD